MLTQQQECFQNIKTLCSNYRKDSLSRKTEDYLVRRLESLESQWNDFYSRHQNLVETMENKNINYFTEDVFGNLKELYESTKNNMQGLLQELREKKTVIFDMSGMLEDDADPILTTLVERQKCNFKALDRVMSKIDINTVTEKWELEDYLAILKSKWDSIDKQHWELETILKGSNYKYYNSFTAIEGKYDEMRRSLNSKIWSTSHYERSAPKMDVPEFSGNYIQWISFKDLFTETIHNNPMINRAQKMQHLKTRLRGEAERLIQHLSINSENYLTCWEILTQRYDNRRLQFTSFINTMLNLPVIQHPDNYNLKKMHDVITECLNGLANIQIDTTTWDPLIVHLMSQKLDATTYSDYMKELQDHRELQPLNEFLYFLESKFMAYETMKNAKKELPTLQKQPFTKSSSKYYPVKKQHFEPKMPFSKTYFTAFGQCPNCSGNHVLMQCPKFIDMNPIQRNNIVAKLQVCANCLYSHRNNKCSSMKTCKECNLKHHTLLHNTIRKNILTENVNNSTNNYTDVRPSTSTQKSANHLSKKELEILLPTAKLQVTSANGTKITLRALLDQGSQVNLITEKAAQMLRLPRKRLNATISGVGNVSGDCKGRIQITCKSIHSDYSFEAQTLIMKKLTNNLPNSSFKKGNWAHLENLKLADPDFNMSHPIDLLLGADVYSDVLLDGVLKGCQQSPIAQQTQLGWILCGKLNTLNCHVTLVDLSEITKYWESEDIVQDDKDISKDNYCEQHYLKTVQRRPDGRYIVKMPLCNDYEHRMGKSRPIALSQFLQLEKRLEKNKKLALMYYDFIKEYTELGHMKPSRPISTDSPQYYLPHHGVLREQSTTTKLRVVFNASQKTSSGFSLNQLQEKGPNIQKDIQELVLKWRSYKYAYTADIEKMYRCIEVAQEQQKLQKIIWRDNPSKELKEYELCTVTYGMKCAPWLAMRTLKQLAMDDGEKYPEAAVILQSELYVDDLISGHNSILEANDLQKSLINLLNGAGMNLRKWSANEPALLQNLSEVQISTSNNFDFKDEETMKTLGLRWNPRNDTFTFNWDLKGIPSKLTKRNLLSEISRLYDPLGWLSPITITAKLIFQRVWTCKTGWDDDLPTDIQRDWLQLRNELPMIENVKIDRWMGGKQNNFELLGFCDASEKAYSCVIYSYVTHKNSPPTITLLAAKTRVAPLTQKITLPRMELCGALLLSQLVQKTKKAFQGHNIKVHAWCDSQVVLAWLQGEVSRWERYVTNRVTKIKQVIPSENWRYVQSNMNPADCASRGLHPKKLLQFNLWWKGPDFLKTWEKGTKNETPKKNLLRPLTTNTISETKALTTLATIQNYNLIDYLLNNCSSLSRVTRVMAWILRFVVNTRGNVKLDSKILTSSELIAAKEQIIKYVQLNEFELEYKLLKKNEVISRKSTIYKLNPYLDDKGIIRVGGRLNYSSLLAEMKNPIILPHKGRFTELLIEQAHTTTLHGGARLTLTYIRQRYWIIGGNRAVKTKLRNCIRCHRYRPTQHHQIMSDLPPHRVSPSRPFTHTGVDFTGHVEVKLNKGRGVRTSKGYIAIFICMATKAVHIELVSDLTTETFIAAFQRMCARRGTPKHMYSDCGTNFIGAAKRLRKDFEEYKQYLSGEFFNEITKLEVEWHFNAPAWPTAGGLWEAAVKSMKYHLHRVLGDQKLTYEEFSTLLAQIEACMNSRPLCPLTEDPEEHYHYLTPGHFLIGGPTMSLPTADYSDPNKINLLRRWQLTENMMQQFWKNWSNEYLTQLQGRSKWNKPTKNIEKGDIVLIKDNNLPPGKWAMGRVIETHPGSDGRVRVTTIKTQTGIIKRPVVKLSPLPLEPKVDLGNRTKTEISKDNQNTITKKGSENKFGKKNIWTLFTTLIIMLALIPGTYSISGDTPSSAHITILEPDRPIYYDTIGKMQTIHDEWTLLLYYNLTNYWTGIKRIKNYFEGLNDLCEKTDPRYCKTTLEQLAHEMDLLDYYNTILLAPQKHLSKRRKRGLINGVGAIANSLFGVLDQNFADKYQQDIEAIQTNENYLLTLIRNQTSIVELENKVLKRKEENMNRHFNMIETFMNDTNTNLAKVESTMEAIMATSYFNSASLTTYLLLKNMKEMQEMLFDSLTDIYKGHLDVHLLTPVTLIEQMNIISGKLPKTLTFPVENIKEDVKNVYKLLYAKARVTGTYFLFEVHIPLTSDEDFLLYKAIPLPMKTGSKTALVQLQSQYIAVNFQKNTYMTITEDDLKVCTQLRLNNLICYKNLPVYSLNNNKTPCEATLLSHHASTPCDVKEIPCNDVWIALHATNSWLAICCGVCTLRTICDNELTSHTISASSIVTLQQGCILQSKDVIIYSHNEYNSKIKMDNFNVPELNSTINNIVDLKHQRLAWNKSQHVMDVELEEIDEKIQSLKEHEALPVSISNHDIHHYVISYVLLGAAIISLIIWIIKKRYYSCSPCKTQTAEPPIYEEIELQQLQRRARLERPTQSKEASSQQPLTQRAQRAHSSTVKSEDNIAFNFDT